MRYRLTFLAWLKGKKWRLTWTKGGERAERYFATEQAAKAYIEQQAAHGGRERIAQARKGRKRGTNTLTVDGCSTPTLPATASGKSHARLTPTTPSTSGGHSDTARRPG